MGRWYYIADHDDLLYLAVSTPAFYDHPFSLSDPAVLTPGRPTVYDRLQFVPGILLARAAGWDILGVSLAWRILAGVSVALAWLGLVGSTIRRPMLAAALTALILSDCGFIGLRPVLKQTAITAHLAHGGPIPGERILTGEDPTKLFGTAPQIFRQWRILSPAMTQVFLFLFLWLFMCARACSTPLRIAAAGLGFGLLFHVYFYYWAAAGLMLALSCLLDSGHRRVALLTGLIGCVIGSPRVIERLQLKRSTSPDWLLRSDLFLPIRHTSELHLPLAGILVLALLSVWVWGRRRDLLPIWLLALSGLVLLNHQLITGLQVQNFHWFNVFGPCASLLLLLFGAGWLAQRIGRRGEYVLLMLSVPYVLFGLGLRWIEVTRTQDTKEIAAAFARYQEQRLKPGVPPLKPAVVVAGDESFINLATLMENQRPLFHYAVRLSPSVSDDELMQRIALNGYLRGMSHEQVIEDRRQAFKASPWGPYVRDPKALDDWLARAGAWYDRIGRDPEGFLTRFEVHYLALPPDQDPLPSRSRWKLIQQGKSWNLWER